MDKYLDSHKNLRVARTLGVAFDSNSNSIGNSNSPKKASIPAELNDGLMAWKEAARKEIDAELTKKYEAMYAKKLKEMNEKEASYKNACTSLTELLDSVKKAGEESLSVCLKDLNSITVMLVLESLYKIIGDDEKYKEYAIRVVEASVNSLAEDITVTGVMSAHDYALLSHEPMFIKFKNFIHPDEKLKKGQFYLDDGSTIYELGILDRLDALRAAFLTAVSQA